MKYLYLIAPFFLSMMGMLEAEVLADSEADFPTSAEQGVNGWTYGYRTVDPDADDPDAYDAEADFVAFDEADGWAWNGNAWDWGDGNPPWTTINATGGHPNGTNSGGAGEQWAVRRWTSTVGPKPLAVSWHLHKNNTNGTGTSVSVNLNGVQVDTGAVEGSDDQGIDQTIYVNVNPGDHLDISLTPVGPTGDRLDGSDGSAWSAVIDDTIPDNPTQPDGTPFVAVSGDDSDSDGLPDAWELLYAESLDLLSGDVDTDEDGLTNLQEFGEGLVPTDADTDDDGLDDGTELAAGSNPRKADSDGNGLNDSEELIIDDVVAAKVADSIEDFSGEQGAGGWFNGYRNFTLDGGGDHYTVDEDFIAFPETAWIGDSWDLDEGAGGAPWTSISAESIHPNGINNGAEHWSIRRWVVEGIEQPTALSVIWKVSEDNLAGTGVAGTLHVNGAQVAKQLIAGGDAVGSTRLFYVNVKPGDVIDLGLTPEGAGGDGSDGSDGSLTSMVVSTFIPEGARHVDGAEFFPVTGEDSDSDGLPDAWERQFFPDDLAALSALGDQDGDGLNDLDELLLRAEPNNADTDGDGLPDGAERGDGRFVDATQAGSQVLIADTDSDGLSDGEEANGNPATKPHKADTDRDGFTDAEEVAGGFDPTDPDSNEFATLVAYSLTDFSEIQGQDNWFHGYRDLGGLPEEESVDYDPVADFIAYPDDWWSGIQWEIPNFDGENAPWTNLGRESAHPNGTNSLQLEHWSIRRWVAADLEAPTPLALTYRLSKTQGNNGGNGTTAQLHLNGELKDSIVIAGNNQEGVIRTFYANVNPGDFVDLALTPVGEDEGRGDGSDSSLFWLRVDASIPDNPMQPDGTAFEPFVLGDPHLGIPFRTPFGLLVDNPGVQSRTVTLSNPGASQDLTITAATLIGVDRDRFSSDLSVPLTLAPGASQEFTVTFDPQGADGGFIASLEFASNDENETTRILDLNANIPDPNKLLAWYKMDETEGTRLNDSSGNGHHGTYVTSDGAILLGQAGLAGGTAASFTPGAEAAYAEVANLPGLEAGFSISLWHQPTADLADVAGLFAKGDGSAEPTLGDPYALAVASGQLTWFGGGNQDITGTGSVTGGQAQHVTVTYDPNDDGSGTVKVYIDGVLTETKEDSTEVTDDRGPLQLGAVNGMFGYSGLLDDLQIYGRTLSDTEVAELQANPGQKLGGGNTPEPEPDSAFRSSLTNIAKSETGVLVGSSLGNVDTYDVEYSEDLVSWVVIATGVTVGPFQDTDPARAARASGYYRVKE